MVDKALPQLCKLLNHAIVICDQDRADLWQTLGGWQGERICGERKVTQGCHKWKRRHNRAALL